MILRRAFLNMSPSCCWTGADSVGLPRADGACARSCIKKIAISEPLVDTVNQEQICTKPCQVVLSAPELFLLATGLRLWLSRPGRQDGQKPCASKGLHACKPLRECDCLNACNAFAPCVLCGDGDGSGTGNDAWRTQQAVTHASLLPRVHVHAYTHAWQLKMIDIHTCKKEDLAFDAKWKLVCGRVACMSAWGVCWRCARASTQQLVGSCGVAVACAQECACVECFAHPCLLTRAVHTMAMLAACRPCRATTT